MGKERFGGEEIHHALSLLEKGVCIHSVASDLGVSRQTIHRWRRQYGGSPATIIQRLRSLERVTRRLRASVSHLTLDHTLLLDVLQPEEPTTEQKQEVVRTLQSRHRVSERRICRVLGWSRSSIRYAPVARDSGDLRRRLRELAVLRPRCGYRTLWQLLRREGWPVNHKRVYRLYQEEGLGDPDTRRRVAEDMRRSGLEPAPYQPQLESMSA